MFNNVLASGSHPREWGVGGAHTEPYLRVLRGMPTLSPTFKGKGSSDECAKHRGASVANSTAKIYGREIGAQLAGLLEHKGLGAWSQPGAGAVGKWGSAPLLCVAAPDK